MDVERRSRLTILKRGYRPAEVQDKALSSVPGKDYWVEWANDLWMEIARVHKLVDQVDAEITRMMSDDYMRILQILEKNSEARELQAYYKGIRFAMDRRKQIESREGTETEQIAEQTTELVAAVRAK